GCTSLTSITIPENVTEIGWSAFSGCTSLTSITIPENVTEIGMNTFEKCTSLTNITIPENVTKIGWSAFEECTSLTSITIPKNVTLIMNYAFYGCTSLTSVYCKATTPPSIFDDTHSCRIFDGNASNRKIYVPNESVGAYKSAEYWKKYASSIVGYEF
ncbi:MAG: leucine-rich repeat domain-containing protein, partial [Rikenellaceae bacterium]|nr:leucine-rich repeat domain-containing protein [Rikenellaceae bacterium]